MKRAFISYSHDSPEHKAWVRDLGAQLLSKGVDVILDQWDIVAGDDIPMFMERNLRDCDFVLLICTLQYVFKSNNGAGGVGYEKMIVSAELARQMDQRKFIPILRQQSTNNVPTFLSSKKYVDLSSDSSFEAGVHELLQAIHRDELDIKPPLGTQNSLFRSNLSTISNYAVGAQFKKYMCLICGWIFDEETGWPEDGIPAGIRWQDVPQNWTCPDCGARKDDFEMVEI